MYKLYTYICYTKFQVSCICSYLYRVTCGMPARGFSWHAGRGGSFVVDASMVKQEIPTEEASYLSQKS